MSEPGEKDHGQSDDTSATHAPRVWPVLERLDADDVHASCRALNPGGLRHLADLLEVPAAALTRDGSSDRVVRRRLRKAGPKKTVHAAGLLAEATLQLVIDRLGPERSANPTVSDLHEVLPSAVDEHGLRRVALVLAVAVDEEWPAADACAEILDCDPRFELTALGPVVDDDAPRAEETSRPVEADETARERRRARKQEARAAKKGDAKTPRVRYRKQRDASQEGRDDGNDPQSDGELPTVTLNGQDGHLQTHERRLVRIVHAYPDLKRDDPLVGRIVLAHIRYSGRIVGAKDRPCVVVAASGRHHLVVRTCYSEGGIRAGDFRAVPVSDLEAAGLDRATTVSHEERLIPRSAVKTTFGWLPIADWNQL